MRIDRLSDLPDRTALLPALDAIFFEASGTKSFVDARARAAFRQRWLGLYLDAWPDLVFVARADGGAVAGYLIGSLADPSRDARFDDFGYFKTFAEACARFPAHLHINLAPEYRGRGIGGDLITAFAAAARHAGAPGMHIVTSKTARNAGFYGQQGFTVIDEAPWNAGAVVFMGRRLDQPVMS